MKRKAMALLAAALVTISGAAAGQEAGEALLPSIACFSPGLVQMSEAMGRGEGLRATAEFTAEKALFARDISLLSDMLEGTTFTYVGKPGHDSLTIARQDETLCSVSLNGDDAGVVLTVNGETMALDASLTGSAAASGFADAQAFLLGTPILERAPLEDVAAWLCGLGVGDALPGGFAMTRAFAAERTMSDDGTRLTRVDIDGEIGRSGQTPWQITGFLRQPAGRSPKDTFEITIRRDERNFFDISYSAQRENEIVRKEKEGSTKVRTVLNVSGRLDGYNVQLRLKVNATNDWKADGPTLVERITLSTTLGYTDRRPLSAKTNRDDLSATMRHELTVTTRDGEADVTLADEASAEVLMGGNTLLAGGMRMDVSAGPGVSAQLDAAAGEQAVATGGEATLIAGVDEIKEALSRAAIRMSTALHGQLSGSEAYRKKIAP